MSDVSKSRQFLTFTLDGEVFALDINTVREVLELTSITRVPRMPAYMRGVINLRGHVVPVMDLRSKFGLECSKDTVNTCIIIVEVLGSAGSCIMGALADSVCEVLELDVQAIAPAPKMGTAVQSDFLKGIGHNGERFIMLLAAERIFSDDELARAGEAASADESMGDLLELADAPGAECLAR